MVPSNACGGPCVDLTSDLSAWLTRDILESFNTYLEPTLPFSSFFQRPGRQRCPPLSHSPQHLCYRVYFKSYTHSIPFFHKSILQSFSLAELPHYYFNLFLYLFLSFLDLPARLSFEHGRITSPVRSERTHESCGVTPASAYSTFEPEHHTEYAYGVLYRALIPPQDLPVLSMFCVNHSGLKHRTHPTNLLQLQPAGHSTFSLRRPVPEHIGS